MKIFKTSLLSCFLLLSLNANDKTYVIEAKGDFGKELKALVEKHAKDEEISINVYEESVPDGRFLGTGLNRNIDYSASRGEEIYNANCIECHGEKGTKRSYATARRLSQMSGSEIYYSFQAYYSEPEHGGSGRLTMIPIASRITSTELGYIIAYLKGNDDYVFGNDKSRINSTISTNPTHQGTYLK